MHKIHINHNLQNLYIHVELYKFSDYKIYP